MGEKSPRIDAVFVDRKRRQLMRLRVELRRSGNATEAEEADYRSESHQQAREYEDEAQKLDALEREGNLVGHDINRLARVERALEKIAEGTYGLSDISGQRIPYDRLEVMPEAICTLSEQAVSQG